MRGARLIVVLVATVACARAPLAVQEIRAPAAPGSGEPSIETGANGHAYLSWIEPAGDGSALRFSVWNDSAWSEPRTVSAGSDWFVNWADFPALTALDDDTLVAHWLRRTGGAPYAYGVEIALSSDGGTHWSAPIVPHDTSPTEHGFVSKVPLPGGRVAVIWLDGRDTVGGHDAHTGAMALRAAILSSAGAVQREERIDDRVCDCCQTAAALAGDGSVVVAYRDRSADEIRDISVVRLDGSGWSAPVSVHHDGWKIAGCPVNGPALAARGNRLALAWFTSPGATPEPRVRLAFSDDAGRTFDRPIEVVIGRALGRVDVALVDSGNALVTWLEEDGDIARLLARTVARDGTSGRPVTVAVTSAARASGFPRSTLVGSDLILAWTDTAGPTRIRTAVLTPGG